MPTKEQVQAAVEAHCRLWNAQDREAWMELFADDVTFDDPVGAPTKHGRGAMQDTWDRSFTSGRVWRLVPERIIVCGDEAAVTMRNEGELHGQGVVVESVEIWKVSDDGRVRAVRAYFDADPEVHADYWLTEGVRRTEQ